MKDKERNINMRLAVIIAVILAAAFYFIFDPMDTQFMPQCVFHKLTGLQCIGCGSQRMLHALLHGDISGAFRANALVTVSLPGIVFLIWVEMQRTKRPRLYNKVYSPVLIAAVGIIFAIWMIIRNIIGI